MNKIFNILNLKQKKLLFIIIFLLFVLSALEISTLYFLQGALSYFTNLSVSAGIEKITNNNFLNYSPIRIILFLFSFLFTTRCLFSIFINYRKNLLIKDINDYLSYKIYKNYLNQNFEFFLNKNSSNIISNILIEVDKFAYRVVDAILILCVELFIVTAVLVFLFFNYFNSTFFLLGIIFIFFGLFYKIFKNKFLELGKKKLHFDQKKLQDLQNSLHVVQNIKLDHLEEIFSNRFLFNTNLASKSQFFANFMLEFIKPLIEFLVLVLFILILLFFFFYLQISKQEIIMMIGLFVVAMFRILPSCNRTLNAFNTIRYYYSTIHLISDELRSPVVNNSIQQNERLQKKDLVFKNLIELKNLYFNYTDHAKKVEILNNINIKIKKNEFIGILGDSGTGKTTLLNVICYLLKPSSGSLLLDNIDVSDNYISYQKKIGYVSQNTYLIDGSVIENIIFGVDKKDYNYDVFNRVIDLSNISEFLNKLPLGKDELIGEKGSKLSGGQKQRIGIARALYKNPEILILDEATSALDLNNEKIIINNIKKINNITAIVVSHNVNTLKICDNVYKIEDKTLKKINLN
jgi:ABC-type multidrug transport system fused ATPase/permease subunit